MLLLFSYNKIDVFVLMYSSMHFKTSINLWNHTRSEYRTVTLSKKFPQEFYSHTFLQSLSLGNRCSVLCPYSFSSSSISRKWSQRICNLVSFLHATEHLWDPFRFSCMSVIGSFLLLTKVLLCGYIPYVLSIWVTYSYFYK